MVFFDQIFAEKPSLSNRDELAEWLIRVFEWLRVPQKSWRLKLEIERQKYFGVRLKQFLSQLDQNTKYKSDFIEIMNHIFGEMSFVPLFLETGLNQKYSLFEDLLSRVSEKSLPRRSPARDIDSFFVALFPENDDIESISATPVETIKDFILLFKDSKELIDRMHFDLEQSLHVLMLQICTHAIQIKSELGFLKNVDDHIFDIREFQNEFSKAVENKNFDLMNLLIQKHISTCENYHHLMEKNGVKLSTVYMIDLQIKRLRRFQTLCELSMYEKSKVDLKALLIHFLVDLASSKSLRSAIQQNFSLLTKKIVEQNSSVGEHYVTRNWSEFYDLLKSALGGGAFTSITVFLKLNIGSILSAGFVKGLFDSLNYSLSFLSIHFLHFTLATKQPSMTAPYLSSSLKESVGQARSNMIALLRSQFVSVLGNMLSVFPVCLFVSWTLKLIGSPVMNKAQATTIFESTALLGPSALYAAFTAVLLFLSSLIAGAFQNWWMINDLENRVQFSLFLRRRFGLERTIRLSTWLTKNSNALAANVSLGLLLGLVPQFFKFLSIPLDVRHVTLAFGAFASSLPVMLEEPMGWLYFLNSFTGILVIGLMNISVSFLLAITLASAATRIKLNYIMNLLLWAIRTVLFKPWLLLIPEDQNEKNRK